MKTTTQHFGAIILIIGFCICAICCNNSIESRKQFKSELGTGAITSQKKLLLDRQSLLSLEDATKILGEKSHLADSASSSKDGVLLRYNCSFKADAAETSSGKTGNLYFLFEQYPDVASAKKRYDFIKTANEKNGINELSDLGNQAYFHSDGQNFYFIMVRKGDRVFNMKVNKITGNTSLDAFNQTAKKITAVISFF